MDPKVLRSLRKRTKQQQKLTCLRDHMRYTEQEIIDTHACSKNALFKNLPRIGLQVRVEKHQARQNIKKQVYRCVSSPALDLLRAQNSPWMGYKIEKNSVLFKHFFYSNGCFTLGCTQIRSTAASSESQRMKMFISTGFTQHHNVSTGNYFSLKT